MITQLLKLRKLKYSQVSVKEELNYLIESYNPKILKNNLINYVNQTPANTLKQSNNSMLKTEIIHSEIYSEQSTFKTIHNTEYCKGNQISNNSIKTISKNVKNPCTSLKFFSKMNKNLTNTLNNSNHSPKRIDSIPNNHLISPKNESNIGNKISFLGKISLKNVIINNSPMIPNDIANQTKINVHDCLLIDNYNRLFNTKNYFYNTLRIKIDQSKKFYSRIKFENKIKEIEGIIKILNISQK